MAIVQQHGIDCGAILEAVREYRRKGWLPTPLNGKNPSVGGAGWQDREHGDEEFVAGTNVGVILANGLVDIDLDSAETRYAAPYLLPPTKAVFGRPSSPRSHWFYQTEETLNTKQFADPIVSGEVKNRMLVELRSGNRSHQTMVPPSIHPSGEPLEWVENGNPANVESAALLHAVTRLAAAGVIGRYWPTSQRHLAALALAGGLARHGWPKNDVVQFVAAVSAAAQDEESRDRVRAAQDTYDRLARDGHTTGWTTLRKFLADCAPILEEVWRWLNIGSDIRSISEGSELFEHEIRPREYADDAIALAFTQRYGDDLRYSALWGRWSKWDGMCWRRDETLAVFDMIRKFCREISVGCSDRLARRVASAQTVAAVERLIRADRRHAATVDQWDSDPMLLNTPAGMVDLRTGVLRAHRREDYCTKITIASPGGECPRWKEFLNRITAGNQELQDYLQRVCGYCLTGITREQVLFFLYGTGANGKSVFVNTMARVLSDYSGVAPVEAFLSSGFERHPTDLAGLVGRRFVTAIETEQGRRWAEAKIKTLTGGDPVSVRFMRQDFFEYVPQFKLVIAGNHKPGLRSVDEAMRRRLHLLPFTVTIPPEERDLQLPERLREEWGGILQWAIQGCQAWQHEGLYPPAVVREATEEYLAAEDVIGRWLEESCVTGNPFTAGTAVLFADYKEWCDGIGEEPGSMKTFSEAVERHGFKKVRIGSRQLRGFDGLALRADLSEVGYQTD